ncbi:MAG: alpha-amylase family glycosyl hydrolase [bacterium]
MYNRTLPPFRTGGGAVAVLLCLGLLMGCGDDDSGASCDDLDCGAHGSCTEIGDVAYCECDTGYTGDTCGDCDLGYAPAGDECVLDADPFFGTPTIDGNVSEGIGDWTADQRVGTNSTATDWGANVMTALYVAYDDTHLYLGVVGFVESQNALVVYVDTDYGASSQGLQSIAAATDNDGALDNCLSADLTVTDTSFRADWGVGTKGMASTAGDAMTDEAGWRNIALDAADFPWIDGALQSGTSGFEAAIPLSELFGGPPPAGRQLGIFARLVNEDGRFLANQTLPADDPADPTTVSQVAVITFGGSAVACNHDGTCDANESTTTCPDDCPSATCDDDGVCEAGETTASCPNDCPPGNECGDPTVFQWEDAVLYFVMVDRFADGDGANDPVPGVNDFAAQYQGGDWAGAEAQLGYLANLGVNTLWLSAPYENRNTAGEAIDPASDPHMYSAYHGYWPSPADIDYSDPQNPTPVPAVESRLGTAAELHSLIDAAHTAGMYVLFDYVMNHVDVESPLYQNHTGWFANDLGNTVLCPPNNWDDPYWGTRCAFTNYLPPFDYYQATVRDWSVADALWWAREYGIDGYRLDAIKHVPMEWLTDLRAALNGAYPSPAGGRFYLVGETYAYDDQGLLRSFIDPSTRLDGQFDFPLRKRICDALFARSMDLSSLFTWMDGNDTFYNPGTLMTTWIGNHDIPRAIHFANGQISDCYQGSSPANGWNPSAYPQPTDPVPYERLGLAFGILMTTRGIPLIYYGDEIGLAGGGDPDNRRMMQFTGLNAQQSALLDLVTTLTQIRSDNVALRRGTRQTLTSGTDTFAYRMTGCGPTEDIYILLNRGDSTASVNGLPAGTYTELLSDTTVTGGNPQDVPPRSLRIFKAQ